MTFSGSVDKRGIKGNVGFPFGCVDKGSKFGFKTKEANLPSAGVLSCFIYAHFTHITLATEAQEIIAEFSRIIETQVTKKIVKKIYSRASSKNLFEPFLSRHVFRPHLN
jgi:hypothetical protein